MKSTSKVGARTFRSTHRGAKERIAIECRGFQGPARKRTEMSDLAASDLRRPTRHLPPVFFPMISMGIRLHLAWNFAGNLARALPRRCLLPRLVSNLEDSARINPCRRRSSARRHCLAIASGESVDERSAVTVQGHGKSGLANPRLALGRCDGIGGRRGMTALVVNVLPRRFPILPKGARWPCSCCR